MSLPVREIPCKIRKLLSFYKKYFTRPQYKNFRDMVCGLIVSDNKTVQEIADCFGRVDQCNLNRFLTESDWDVKRINNVRLSQIKKKVRLKKGILIADPTMLHKSGKHMEKANYHYSGMTKKKEWGHLLVNSFFTDGETSFPVCADFYLREQDADEQHPFKTVRELCLEQLDYALKRLPIWLFIGDAGLYADFLIQDIRSRCLKYILGTRITNKISIDRRERISIKEYLESLTDDDFGLYVINGVVYFLHTVEITERCVGKEKLVVSYKLGDEENVRVYVTNLLKQSDETLMNLVLKRWAIEVWHRDAKQHLGLEDYQVRKYRGIQKVVLAILVAYTQIILSKAQAILKPLKRVLQTVGESCRFFRLVAVKGMHWLRQKANDPNKLREILNDYVFVKNAKV